VHHLRKSLQLLNDRDGLIPFGKPEKNFHTALQYYSNILYLRIIQYLKYYYTLGAAIIYTIIFDIKNK